MQFSFMPGVGTTDAVFIMHQLQEKYLAKRRNLYLAFVDLEKAFDRVPRKVIWWAMRVVKIPDWIITLVKAMYDVRSRVRVDCEYAMCFGQCWCTSGFSIKSLAVPDGFRGIIS